MSKAPPAILLCDASVLIDYVAADIRILEIMATCIWKLATIIPVLREVKGLTKEKAEKIGITIHEPTFDELMDAAKPVAGLSSEDRLCLAITRKRRWSCLTNDVRLRKSCTECDVQVVWGLEAMIFLHRGGFIEKERAIKTAKTIQTSNPFHITDIVLKQFLQNLEK